MQSLIRKALNYRYFSKDGSAPIQVSYEKGTADSKLLILTGDNATGKSFFLRLFHALCTKDKIECMRVGMEMRTQGGIEKVFIYGDENSDSTGNISVKCVLGGVQSSKTRTKKHYLVFDEPDTGLSEGYQHAVGLYLAKFMDQLPPKNKGLLISTHSRYLVQPLLSYHPHHLRFGDEQTLVEWVKNEPTPRSIEDLLSLKDRAHTRFLKIAKMIDRK